MRLATGRSFLHWFYIASMILMLVFVLTSYFLNIPFSNLTRDPLAIAGRHPLLGILSNIGIIIWSFAVLVCFYSYGLLRVSKSTNHGILQMILFGGILSFILMLDDLFMLHEYIYPIYLGVSQAVTISIYGLLVLFYLLKFRKIIIETDYMILLSSFLFFSLSIFFDKFSPCSLSWRYLLEDGAKFFGIVSWFSYQFSLCFQEVFSKFKDHAHINSLPH